MSEGLNCPKCGELMHQEAQNEYSIKGIGSLYDYDTKKWIIPDEIIMEFVRYFRCNKSGCGVLNKYTYIDGNYTYRLER